MTDQGSDESTLPTWKNFCSGSVNHHSIRSRNSSHSAYSSNAWYSVLSVNAFVSLIGINAWFSIGGVNTILCIGGLNSLLSIGSVNSFLSIGCANSFMKNCLRKEKSSGRRMVQICGQDSVFDANAVAGHCVFDKDRSFEDLLDTGLTQVACVREGGKWKSYPCEDLVGSNSFNMDYDGRTVWADMCCVKATTNF